MTKLQDVNTTDIAGAIRLGCETMGNVFNADDNDVPFSGRSSIPKPGSASTTRTPTRTSPGATSTPS